MILEIERDEDTGYEWVTPPQRRINPSRMEKNNLQKLCHFVVGTIESFIIIIIIKIGN